MYPWEKLILTHTNKKINAKIDLSYIDPVTKIKVSHNSEIQIDVAYDEIVKTWNFGLILLILLAIIIRWIIKRRKK